MAELDLVLGHRLGAWWREHAVEAGLTRPDIQRRLATGEWRALHPNVFAAGTGPLSALTQLSADLMHAGPSAWASYQSAAALYGLQRLVPSTGRCVTVPLGRQPSKRPGLQVARSRRLEGVTTTRHGLPCLSLSRTVVDLAQVLSRRGLSEVVSEVLRSSALTRGDLEAASSGLSGRRGIALLREVLDEFDPLHESILEGELLPLLEKAGWTGLVPQHQVIVEGVIIARLDFADPVARQGFEADGYSFHSSPSAMARDRQRDRRLLDQASYQVARFLTHEIRRDAGSVVREAARLREVCPRRAA